MGEAFKCDICKILNDGPVHYTISISSKLPSKKYPNGVKSYETCSKCLTKVNRVLI